MVNAGISGMWSSCESQKAESAEMLIAKHSMQAKRRLEVAVQEVRHATEVGQDTKADPVP